MSLKALLPYKRSCERWSIGKIVTSNFTIWGILPSYVLRKAMKRGQHSKKWVEVSSSAPQEHNGLEQLNSWLNL